MKKLIFCLSLFFIMTISSSTAISDTKQLSIHSSLKNLHLKSIDKILLYCNTKEFIKDVVTNSYRMNLAALGLVHDGKHKHLASTELWINLNKKQWAIVFVYKKRDSSCILGGNDIELFTP